jgi:hypothetical protein
VQNSPIELVTSIAIFAGSVMLFWYWFRYACLLILAAETPHDYTEEVARANQLSFPEVRSRLRKHDVTDLDRLHKCLESLNLLEHTPITSFDFGFDDAILKIHFRTMSACFHLTRRNFREFASDALEEMSRVVVHFANAMGERTLTGANQRDGGS